MGQGHAGLFCRSSSGQVQVALCSSTCGDLQSTAEDIADAMPATDWGEALNLTNKPEAPCERSSSRHWSLGSTASGAVRKMSLEGQSRMSSKHTRISSQESVMCVQSSASDGSTIHPVGPSPSYAEGQAGFPRGSSLLCDSMASLNSLALLPSIRRKLRNFREQMEREEEPTEDELVRGVHLQKTYDFYDPVSKKIRVRKMFDDVLHKRTRDTMATDRATDDDSQGVLSENTVSPGGSLTDTTTVTSTDGEWSEDGRAPSPQRRRKRVSTLTNLEKVTYWGVLVGKLLHQEFAMDDAMTDWNTMRKKLSTDHNEQPSFRFHLATCVAQRARCVAKKAEQLTRQILDAPDEFDHDWYWQDEPRLFEYLLGQEYLDTIILLANTARKMVAKQPVLVELDAPCRVFGDIHGQLRDMLFLFGAFGSPSPKGIHFVFNGDFVDRGSHQVSTLVVLLALKVAMPDKVWLIRGNHEDKSMNERYGFQEACTKTFGNTFGPKVYDTFHKVFDQLPVACLISERILVLHGGIGDGLWSLRDLRNIRRPLSSQALAASANKWISNLLWSDPIEEDDTSMSGVFGVHASPRGQLGLCFAWDLTRQFCARQGLGLIIRSHQSKQGSVGFDIMHDQMLVRVFSARDYEEHGNDGAVLLVTPSHDGKLVSVRPQVLRSATKASDEEVIRKLVSVDRPPSPPSRRENMAMRRATQRREAMYRRQRDGGTELFAMKGWLWRLKETGKRMKEKDWLWEEITVQRSGGLVSSGGASLRGTAEGEEIVLIEPGGLCSARLAKVASHQAWAPCAFQVLFANKDGEMARLMLAAESREDRSRWMREMRSFSLPQ